MKKWMLVFSIFAVILVVAACGSDTEKTEKGTQTETETSKAADTPEQTEAAKETAVSAENTASLKLLENEKVGEYLADSQGMTLYYFKKDESGKSNCSGECLKNWPPLAETDFEVPDGLDKKDFGTITREDTGAEQVTYKGFPLYYFVNDKNEGDVNGQGVKDVWFVINSETSFQ
jgi:predicted lipoprotein with Yx(FWY)xxD motif